jgi:hypothetical protein
VINHTADTTGGEQRRMFSDGPAVREARSRANPVLGTDSHDAGHDSASRSVKAHFCDRHHIASVFL